jgi:hypothetical protein
VTLSRAAERESARKSARARLARQIVENLLRAGPTATRNALVEDPTLVGFLDPAQYAQLAEYAKPPPPAVTVKPGEDVFRVMRQRIPWHRRAVESARDRVPPILITAVIFWLSYRVLLHVVPIR